MVWIHGPDCAGHLHGGHRVGLWWDRMPDGSERLSVWRAGSLVVALSCPALPGARARAYIRANRGRKRSTVHGTRYRPMPDAAFSLKADARRM